MRRNVICAHLQLIADVDVYFQFFTSFNFVFSLLFLLQYFVSLIMDFACFHRIDFGVNISMNSTDYVADCVFLEQFF